MMTNLTSIASNIPTIPSATALGKADAASAGGVSFQDMLVDSLNQVNSMQAEANDAVESLAVGGDVNPAEVLTAVQKADLAFRLTMQIRNKLVQAYQEIQNIRI